MSKYEVEVTGSFTTYVEVEADDEDAAHDEGKKLVEELGTMNEWSDDRMYRVDNVTLVTP